ncbi:MAG: DUF4091 domain-containing protein [Tannerella sp.]|jgi:hypothetical protein|nr:DUF4091 domain-containing protein [Tannerella sp.]
MKIRYIFLSLLLIACTGTRPYKSCETYSEAVDPSPDITANWNNVPAGLNVSFGDIDNLYVKSAVPDVGKNLSWTGCGWRGERLSAQVVLWSAEVVEQVEYEFSPFKSSGAALDASIARARFVRYVLTDEFGNACGYHDPEVYPPSLSADMLDTLTCFSLEAKTARPLWLSFDIPADAVPGTYSGTLTIHAGNRKSQKLNVSFEILPQTLPDPKDWVFHLDLWQHPSAVARANNVKHWSEEHWALLETQMALLASAGQKVITATLNKDPWNHQCFDAYEDMIVWTKHKDGSWSYDYSIFDRWVELMMRLGISKQINCYSMIPWNNELHYYDEAKGVFTDVQATPGAESFGNMWTPFLKDFSSHLQSKGWLNITNIAMDERPPKDMQATLDFLNRTAPEIGVALADNHKSYKRFPMLRDICVAYGATFDEEDLVFRKNNKLVSTYYVACDRLFPNVFTFSTPPEGAYIAWYAIAAGFDGFLRWAYNSWTENPLTDSRFRRFPAGDTYIVYPGGRSSIRFERLREGIQDAEKIRILHEKFMLSSDAEAPAKLAELNAEVAKFNHTIKPDDCAGLLNSAKKALNELSR